MADEIGLSIGDEIIAIGNETLPRYATAKVWKMSEKGDKNKVEKQIKYLT